MSRTANRPRGGNSWKDSTHKGLVGTRVIIAASPDLMALGFSSVVLPNRKTQRKKNYSQGLLFSPLLFKSFSLERFFSPLQISREYFVICWYLFIFSILSSCIIKTKSRFSGKIFFLKTISIFRAFTPFTRFSFRLVEENERKWRVSETLRVVRGCEKRIRE